MLLIASAAATAAVVIGGYILGPIAPGANILRTPIPYTLLFVSVFVASPVYLLVQPYLRLRLWRFLLAGLCLGLVLFLVWANQWAWNLQSARPGNLRWLFGLPLLAVLAYWSVLRALAPEFDD